MSIIEYWKQRIKENRRSWEQITAGDLAAILQEAEPALTDQPSKLNKAFSKRQAHEVFSSIDYEGMGPRAFRLCAKNVVREFVLNRKRI